jgi:hypothetical protein
MALFDEIQKNRIATALHDKGADRQCEACGNDDFIISDGPVYMTTQAMATWGETRAIPAILVACKRCGNARLHLLSLLGLEGFDK